MILLYKLLAPNSLVTVLKTQGVGYLHVSRDVHSLKVKKKAETLPKVITEGVKCY